MAFEVQSPSNDRTSPKSN